jgi:hypothetical protein
MMIDYTTTKPGDKLRITGMGAPGFARLGDVVTVTACNGKNRCDVVNESGESAYFALTCGAQRLEPIAAVPQTGSNDE